MLVFVIISVFLLAPSTTTVNASPNCRFRILDDFGEDFSLVLPNSKIEQVKTDRFNQTTDFGEDFSLVLPNSKIEQVKTDRFNQTTECDEANIPKSSYTICDGDSVDCTVPDNCSTACKIDADGLSGCLSDIDCEIHHNPALKEPVWKICDAANPENPVTWCHALLGNITAGTVEVINGTFCERFSEFWDDPELNENLGATLNRTIVRLKPKFKTPDQDNKALVCETPDNCSQHYYICCQIQARDQEGEVVKKNAREATRTSVCSELTIDLSKLHEDLEFPPWTNQTEWRIMCWAEEVPMNRAEKEGGNCQIDETVNGTAVARWHWRFLNVRPTTSSCTDGVFKCSYSEYIGNSTLANGDYEEHPDFGHISHYTCPSLKYQTCRTGRPNEIRTQEINEQCLQPWKPANETAPKKDNTVPAGPVIGVVIAVVIVLLGIQAGVLFVLSRKKQK